MPKEQYENLSKEERYRFHRNQWLKKKYKISLLEYEEMYSNQEGNCAICGEPETRVSATGSKIVLSVDHNHTTNKVRELLCYKCNVMLDSAKESIEILMNAISYLQKHK